jgi:hypothetical protein
MEHWNETCSSQCESPRLHLLMRIIIPATLRASSTPPLVGTEGKRVPDRGGWMDVGYVDRSQWGDGVAWITSVVHRPWPTQNNGANVKGVIELPIAGDGIQLDEEMEEVNLNAVHRMEVNDEMEEGSRGQRR